MLLHIIQLSIVSIVAINPNMLLILPSTRHHIIQLRNSKGDLCNQAYKVLFLLSWITSTFFSKCITMTRMHLGIVFIYIYNLYDENLDWIYSRLLPTPPALTVEPVSSRVCRMLAGWLQVFSSLGGMHLRATVGTEGRDKLLGSTT